jgi:hypothetical protein
LVGAVVAVAGARLISGRLQFARINEVINKKIVMNGRVLRFTCTLLRL